MIDARITELRFMPSRRSRWAVLRVGMSLDAAIHALGGRTKDRAALYYRVRKGEVVFDLPLPQRGIIASDISDADTGRGAEEPPRQTVIRPCLCCRAPFESEGSGNRMCSSCRTRNVSPYAL
jgi:hypothetical protein